MDVLKYFVLSLDVGRRQDRDHVNVVAATAVAQAGDTAGTSLTHIVQPSLSATVFSTELSVDTRYPHTVSPTSLTSPQFVTV